MSHFRGPLLPALAVPSAYDLRLDLDVDAGSFTGTVSVNVELLENSRFIVLNGVGLTVDMNASSFTPRESSEVVLNGSSSSKFQLILIKFYEEKIVLEFGEFLPKGDGILRLEFNGVINQEDGLFICCGEKEKMYARRCFPCWDEPIYKARFKFNMHVPLEFVALSNMPIMEENVNGDMKLVSFHESPNMPTYLVTMFVGMFDYIGDHTSDGIQVRVYGEVGKSEKGKSALHVALKTLKLFKEYFGVSYPLRKLDLVAVPDLAAEPRESFGLVVCPEPSILYESDQFSTQGDDAAPDASQLNQFLQILGLYMDPKYTERIKELEADIQSMTLKPEFLRLLKSRKAMQQMVSLQRAIFSGYWNTTSQILEQTGATKEETEILVGDVVMNKRTREVSVVSHDKLFVFPIAKAKKEKLRKDEVVVIWRPFCQGQNICLVTDRKKLGIVCGIEMKVDLASLDGDEEYFAHRSKGTESFKRIRRFFKDDYVVHGSWLGIVKRVELRITVRGEDGRRFFADDPDRDSLEPIFKNAAEAYLNEPYYVGQRVVYHEFDPPVRGVVTKHRVNRLNVDWIHCSAVGEEDEEMPPESIFYGEVKRIHDSRFSRTAWSLGERCVFEGKVFVIVRINSMVKVKWQGGLIEEIRSTELMESKEFFSGQFVSKKEEDGVGGYVRMISDGVGWVKWFQDEHPELLHTSELQPHGDYRFHISDLVAEKFGSQARGFIVGMEDGKIEVEWVVDKTISKVGPEEIKRLGCLLGEDPSSEDEYDDVEGPTPSSLLGPTALSGSVLLGPASSSDEDDDSGAEDEDDLTH